MKPKYSITGTTLIEMMIVVALLSVVALATYSLIRETNLSSGTLDGCNLLTQWGQKAIDEINLDLTQARLIYQNDTLGTGYLIKLESDANYPVLTSRRLPLIDPTGTFRQDTIVTRTGNTLLFVKECLPFIAAAGGTNRRVNIYRLVCYYLSSNATPIADKSASLRLIRWESKEFADYEQIMAISAPISRNIFANALFTSRGISWYWIPRNTPTNAFYSFDSDEWDDADDDDIDDAPKAISIIQKDTVQNIIGNLGYGTASVAWNRGSDFWVPDVVPKFGLVDITGAGFPHGFEIQVIGPTGARQVFARLVLAYLVHLNNSLVSNEFITIGVIHEF